MQYSTKPPENAIKQSNRLHIDDIASAIADSFLSAV
jgi:hypothetical protein